jgi:hypothetical protein
MLTILGALVAPLKLQAKRPTGSVAKFVGQLQSHVDVRGGAGMLEQQRGIDAVPVSYFAGVGFVEVGEVQQRALFWIGRGAGSRG